jgi:DNA polymerase III epsilon subunit-like protein
MMKEPKRVIDVMLDLETVGVSAGCGILSIGAVTFDLEKQFHEKISPESCRGVLKESLETLRWWNTQPREIKDDAFSGTKGLTFVLLEFSEWFRSLGPVEDTYIWGNGADFDLPILQAAYETIGREKPWKGYNGRCYRTLKNLLPHVKPQVKNAVRHNALEDAKYQARHAVQLLAMI